MDEPSSTTRERQARLAEAVRLVLRAFDRYYLESRGIPNQAKAAFEERDPNRSLALSRKRLSIYTESIAGLAAELQASFPGATADPGLWGELEELYLPAIRGRYEADLAFAYLHSARRRLLQDEWQPVEYAFGQTAAAAGGLGMEIHLDFPGGTELSPVTVGEILALPYFATAYRDLAGDAALVAARVNADLGLPAQDFGAIEAVQMIDAGFYRNRGAYLVGRLVLRDGSFRPLIIALLNDEAGIYVDAVLTREPEAHNIFSSTLANFHVTNVYYHEVCEFLFSIMPNRPLGLHYSTIGFNHVGKVAVMNELRDELAVSGELFDTAVGFRGTVAIGFSTPSSAYALKVIRDRPTAQYKWGHFEGLQSVLDKYRQVHEINRAGSMLDNIIYYNLKLQRNWFEPALLEELCAEASESVSLQGDAVIFKQLIVQFKMIPLPVFLESASEDEAETAVVNLGHCIKNNSAANIFNKDLDGRNYGVGKSLKVHLFDYDALEVLTEVKIRTNLDRFDGEEDVPDWFFEDGIIFLPEEIEAGLRIPNRALRRLFREVHGDLLTTGYWEGIQADLKGGKVPRISTYPDDRRLSRDGSG